jgi:putative ABC transport system permease protein
LKKLGLFHLAIRNIRRKLFRTVSIIVSVAAVSGTLFSATLVIYSVRKSIAVGTERLGADVLVVPAQAETKAREALITGEPSAFYMSRKVLDQVKKVDGVDKATPQVYIKSAPLACCGVSDVLLIGFDPATDFSVTSWLSNFAGDKFTDDDIIVGRAVPTLPGRTIEFYGKEFNVVGTLAQTGMRYLDNAAFITLNAAYDMARESSKKALETVNVTPDMISTVLVKVKEGMTPQRVAVRINYAVDGVKAIASNEVISTVKEELSKLFTYLLTVGGIVWAMALLLIGVVFSMIVNERQREIGLLRAMGAKRGFMFRLLISEAAILTSIGGILGVAAGGLLVFSFKNLLVKELNVPYLWPSPGLIVSLLVGCIVVSTITGIAAALYPATISARMEPYEAIRKGE